MNRMHVISIPYALMKVNPLSWIQKVCSYKGSRGLPSLALSFFNEFSKTGCLVIKKI